MPNLDILPLSTSELAELSGIRVRQLTRLVAGKKLSYLKKTAGKTGGYLFDPNADDVKALIAERAS